MLANDCRKAFIHVKVPTSMLAATKRAARKQDLNASQFVRRALSRALQEIGEPVGAVAA